jgi:glycosyltransferase involved in cell wall biosynthesis
MASEQGGPPVVCAGLTSALAARGHQVTIATIAEPGETRVNVDAAVRIQTFPGNVNRRLAVFPHLDRWLAHNTASFDIVHVHGIWRFPIFAAARACWQWRKPYVVMPHGMLEYYSVHQRSALFKRMYWLFRGRRIASRAAALHCLNLAESRKAVPWIRDFPKFVLPNGIDAADVAAMPARGAFRARHADWAPRPLVLFLSRLHPKKGLDRLLPAWKALVERMPEARFLIAGTGESEYVASINKFVTDSGLGDKVVFLGQLLGRQKWEALVDADVFVLPSHQEGFSMAITEALAAGCPPVVTEECNFDELEPADKEKTCGVIIKKGNMGAFVDVVCELLTDAQKRHQLSKAGRELVAAQYTWQKIAGELEGIYRRILAGERFPSDL